MRAASCSSDPAPAGTKWRKQNGCVCRNNRWRRGEQCKRPDLILTGAGDDFIGWADAGADTIDGGGGFDGLAFITAAGRQVIGLSGAGGEATFSQASFTVLGPVTNVGISNVELVKISTDEGAVINLNRLIDSGVAQVEVHVDSRSFIGDTVSLTGGSAPEFIQLTPSSATGLTIGEDTFGADGKHVTTKIDQLGSLDRVVINAGASGDVIDASALTGRTASSYGLTLNGTDNADSVRAAPWSEVNTRGGDDAISWSDARHGHVTIDGGGGRDTLHLDRIVGASDLSLTSAGFGRFVVGSASADVRVDAFNVEQLFVGAPAATGVINVGDLTDSGLKLLQFDFNNHDALHETVQFAGTTLNDSIVVDSSVGGGELAINGLNVASVYTENAGIGDTVRVDGGAGSDVIRAASVKATDARLELRGGDGDDTLFGGFHTVLYGGAGSDNLVGGPNGGTTFAFRVGETGTDTVSGFHVGGPSKDLVDLDDFSFRYASNFAQFAAHNLVSDGHGGTNLITDNGQVIADILSVTPNLLGSGNFLLH